MAYVRWQRQTGIPSHAHGKAWKHNTKHVGAIV